MSPWQPATACSRAGAAHLRRGQGSQDWAATRQLRSRDGLEVQILAVADGHGGRRYERSATGSRLACETALAAAATALAEKPLGKASESLEAWRRWLAVELPQQVQTDWLTAIQRDWEQLRPAAAEGEPEAPAFSPLPYGTTLALVVLTPRWWGHTGLGDWDLVRVERGGAAELLSEERAAADAPGEATASLCLPGAAALWAPRATLHPLPAQEGSFSLLLSTDGIRKSCATDADFLALAAHLAQGTAPWDGEGEEPEQAGEPPELAALLDRISREGSGDDVSLALAHWQGAKRPPAQPPGLAMRGRLVVGGLALAATAGLAAGLLALRRTQTLLPAPQAPPAAPPSLPAAPNPPPPQTVQREVQRLCGESPAAILGTLRSRRAQFEGLRSGRLAPAPLLAAAGEDPLGALIGASFDPARRTMVQGAPREALRLCAALQLALQRQWQGQPLGGTQPPPAAVPPPKPTP
ncbi:MAG: protein phosphatase 2C domain-containing protein [Synechococcus sp.]|nr:protein phosphatase 2C domain-containing protein [Synechococcus sp.]